MAEWVERLDDRILKREDIPDYGVVRFLQTLYIPVKVEGQRLFCFWTHRSDESIVAFQSEKTAWEYIKEVRMSNG